MPQDSDGGTIILDDTETENRNRSRGRNARRRMFIDLCFEGKPLPIAPSKDQSGYRPRKRDILLRADYKNGRIQTEHADFSHGIVCYQSSRPVKSYDGAGESCNVEGLVVDGDPTTPALEDVLKGLENNNRIRGRMYIHNGIGYVKISVEEIAQLND